MKKINIAFICDYLEIGGQERICLNMLKGINKSIFNPMVYAFRGGTLVKDIKDLGIKVLIGSKKDPLSFTRGWTLKDEKEKKTYLNILTEAMKNDSIDIALIFSWADGIIAAKEAGVAVLIEKLDGPRLVGKIKDKLCFDRIVLESEMIKIILGQIKDLKCKNEQICVIRPGIDLMKFNRNNYDSKTEREKIGLNHKEFVIGYVGRIADEKNLQLLIRSTELLVVHYRTNDFKVIIMGPDFGELNNLKKLVEKLALKDKVIFISPKNDVSGVLSTFDIFVMTSLIEGVPTAMIEAMSMGLPIISTNVGCIPEIVEKNGFLVDRFSADTLAEYMHLLMEDKELRKNMGEESLRLSKKFDIKRSIKEYEQLFIECLNRNN